MLRAIPNVGKLAIIRGKFLNNWANYAATFTLRQCLCCHSSCLWVTKMYHPTYLWATRRITPITLKLA